MFWFMFDMYSVLWYIGQAAMDEKRRSAVRELLPITASGNMPEFIAANMGFVFGNSCIFKCC